MDYSLVKIRASDVLEIAVYGVFLYSALDKLINPLSLTAALLRVSLLPESWVEWLTLLIPLGEIAVVVLGNFEKTRRLAYVMILFFLVVFSVHLIMAGIKDPKSACGCGGILEILTIPQHLALNVILLFITLRLLIKSSTRADK